MKKKIVSLLLGFTMIFSLGLTACDDAGLKRNCSHEYTKSTFLEATCISEGVEQKTCKKCGAIDYNKTEKIAHEYQNGFCVTCKVAEPKTPCSHAYEEKTFVQATCVSEGVLQKTCSTCGDTKYEKVEKAKHSYVEGVCVTCNTADPNAAPCSHTYTEETFLKATCISEGVLKKTCTNCQEVFYERTSKLTHAFVEGVCDVCKTADPSWKDTIIFPADDPSLDLGDCKHSVLVTVTQAPTCSELGMKLEVCNDCGKVTVLEGYAATSAHTWAEKIAAPTCISDGVKYRQCEICGTQQFIELLKKLGHDKQNGVCTRCEGDNVGVQNKTINVQVFKGSYGANWVYEIAEKFEEVYKEEGYQVNVLKPTSDMRNDVAIQELARGYEQTQVDMYITGGVSSNKVGREGAHGVLAEEIYDLWDAKPIGFDGREENKTLREKVTKGTVDAYKDNYGDTYGIPYIAMTGGMVVNTRKLEMYGINTLPTTTNELFDMWTAIYCGANGMGNSIETTIFPFTYIPGGNGYTIDWWMAAMAQYDETLSKEYWSWQTEEADGSVTWWENGVENAVNDALLVSLEVMAQAFDYNIAVRGSSSQSLDQAQAQIMKRDGGAIFMCNGSWYINDMVLNSPSSLEDITFINFPVVSALADKLWMDTVSDANKREEMLRYAISQVDDLSKVDNAQAIATDMTAQFATTVTKADVEEVRRARYAYSDRTSGNQMVITKGTPKADICKLFMRMIASDDGAQVISEKANGTSAYMTSVNTYSDYTFVNEASKIHTNAYATAHSNQAKGYRYAVGITQNTVFTGHIIDYIVNYVNAGSIYTRNGDMNGLTVGDAYGPLVNHILYEEKQRLEHEFDVWKTQNAVRIEKYKQIWGYNG